MLLLPSFGKSIGTGVTEAASYIHAVDNFSPLDTDETKGEYPSHEAGLKRTGRHPGHRAR